MPVGLARRGVNRDMKFVLHLVSRLIGVLLVSIPLAYAGYTFDQSELEMIAVFTHEELQLHMRSSLVKAFPKPSLLS